MTIGTGAPTMLETQRRRIAELKRSLDAVILAHNYQNPEVQDVADFVGDSLELARLATGMASRYIVLCGVSFMAETAAVINPTRKVLLAESTASCPMAEMIDVQKLRQWKAQHPKATVVCYVNSSAAVKAESDICCTSANAVRVVESLESDEVLMAPDMNLARYVANNSTKRIVAYPGFCPIHHNLLPEQVLEAKARHPEALTLAHPECRPEVLALADAALSTSQMLRYVAESPANSFIIATECGLFHSLRRSNPTKQFYPASDALMCPDMKKTTLDSIIRTMELEHIVVSVPQDVADGASRSIRRMLEVG